MFSVSVHTCPWISILPSTVMEQLKKEKDAVSLIKLLVKVTKQSLEIYESGKFAHHDALVGNYGCETHAFNILSLAHNQELLAEFPSVEKICAEVSQSICNRQGIRNNNLRSPINQFYHQLEGLGAISERMKYLIQSRLLTITKTAKYDATKYDSRDYEELSTTPGNLRKVIKMSVDNPVLNEIVSITQSQLSSSSILFMRAKLNELIITQNDEERLVKQMLLEENLCIYSSRAPVRMNIKVHPKTYSCCYYNTKALLLLLAELRAPLIIKKMTKIDEPIEQYFFNSCAEFGEFQRMTEREIDNCLPETPVVVCTVYLPDKMAPLEWLAKVDQYGLGNLILASASQGSQYIPNKPDVFPIPMAEAEAEITLQAEVKSKEFECVWMQNSIFDLDHFYCSSWGQRGEKIGEYKS